MEGTVGGAGRVFAECLEIINEKDHKYGSMWKDEDIEELWGNVSRKFKGVEHQFKNGGKVDLEFPLDAINYMVFFYLRLVDENRGL